MNLKKQNRILFIDYAKGFAMLSIVLYHYLYVLKINPTLKKAVMFGGTGVHFFLFLSGFGLMLSKTTAVQTFYKRRLLKIYTPYILCILILFVINAVILINPTVNVYALLGHIFLFKMFDNSITASFGVQFWFMSTLIQLYLAYPLLVWLLKKFQIKWFLITTIIISVAYWLFLYKMQLGNIRVYNSFFLQYLWEFGLGMVLAKLYTEKEYKFWEQSNSKLIITAITGIGLMGLLVLKGGNAGRLFNDIPAFFGFVALAILVYKFSNFIIKPLNSFLIFTGLISFSLFLTHWFLFKFYIHLLPKLEITFSGKHLFIIVPLVIVISKFYEKFNLFITNKLLQEN